MCLQEIFIFLSFTLYIAVFIVKIDFVNMVRKKQDPKQLAQPIIGTEDLPKDYGNDFTSIFCRLSPILPWF